MAKTKDINNEVIMGNRNNGNGHKERQPGLTGIDFWEGPFSSNPNYNDLEKILEFPGIDDPAGQLARSVIRDPAQGLAIVELIDLCEQLGLERQKKFLRNILAQTLGWYGFGKVMQGSIGTGLMLPGVIREQLQMRKVKSGEDVQRGSDFRTEGRIKEVQQQEC